jgi:hypothetical protein
MKKGFGLAAAIASAALTGAPQLAAAALIGDFTLGDEGWTVVNWSGDGVPVIPQWFGSGGNPDGYIAAVDVHGDGFFRAPASWRGNLSGLYGGSIGYDAFTQYGGFSMADVFIQNSALSAGDPAAVDTISYRFNRNPSALWSRFDALISASPTGGWMWGLMYEATGPSATEAQIMSVLANVTDIRIRQEYAFGPDWSGLDNVTLSANPVPLPPALLLFAPAALGVAALRRRAAIPA